MPRIRDQLLDCVVYLFPSAQDAKDGSRYGGSGFIAGVEYSNNVNLSHGYVVTNEHVVSSAIANRTSTFVRVNLSSGGFDVIEVPWSSWKVEPNGDDLAACSIDDPNKVFRIAVIPEDMFLKKSGHPSEDPRHPFAGIGDDVVMVGRYVDHQGKVRNLPTVRFGNIAQMPHEPILVKARSHKQTCFLVEMRSVSGFSGSPVFILPEHGGLFRDDVRTLLGVDCGHLPLIGKLIDRQGLENTNEFPKIDSMMAMVIPAWILTDLLNDSQFVEQRRRDEEAESKSEPHGAVLDDSRR